MEVIMFNKCLLLASGWIIVPAALFAAGPPETGEASRYVEGYETGYQHGFHDGYVKGHMVPSQTMEGLQKGMGGTGGAEGHGETIPDHGAVNDQWGQNDPKHSFESFSEKLELNDIQKEKIRPLFEAEGSQIQEIMLDQKLSKDEKMNRIKETADRTHADVSRLLDQGQRQKYDAMREERREMYKAIEDDGAMGNGGHP
jgi:hypothetical protein